MTVKQKSRFTPINNYKIKPLSRKVAVVEEVLANTLLIFSVAVKVETKLICYISFCTHRLTYLEELSFCCW